MPVLKGSKNDLARNYKSRHTQLITFLLRTQKKKQELIRENKTLFDFFTVIWRLQDRHIVEGLPKRYIFQLLPCYKKECAHPVCQRGRPEKEPVWYEGGPSFFY